jgi:spore coat polysaccharide biosynthesis predicted glycosyltransferase SpsG
VVVNNDIWFRPKGSGIRRVLFHTINHSGLGHLNRAVSVAQWLKAESPDIQILFLIEGGQDFIEPTGFPWILIPGHNQVTENENCEQITRKVLEVFTPDLMLYETVLHEPICGPVSQAGVKQVLMGNMGGLLRSQLQQNIANVNNLDLLIILQRQEEVLPADQALIAQHRGKTLYAGPLVRQKDQMGGDALRRKLGLADEQKVLLLTFGGGGYVLTRELLTTILAARGDILAAHPHTKLILVTGPYFSGELPETDEFVCYASKFEPFLTDYIHIASAVVCMAGYSTVNEIAASGVPAICVPTAEADDQVGAGGMGEYAQSFPNMRLGSTDTKELVQLIGDALLRERDVSVVREFKQKAEIASQSIASEIIRLLEEGEARWCSN